MMKKFFLPLLPFIVLAVLLETLASQGQIPSYLFPSPSEIWNSLTTDSYEFLTATKTTLIGALSGLALSIVVGVILATILGSSQLLETAFYPYAVFFQTVPLISIAPILVIWFGYGLPTVIASSFIVSVFPIIINTLAGLRATDPSLLDLFQLYGAGRRQTLFFLKIPHAVPQIITGVRVSAGLALIGAIVGEFIGGGGLGGLIDAARTQQRLDKIFAAVLISSLVGIILLSFIRLASITLFRQYRELSN